MSRSRVSPCSQFMVRRSPVAYSSDATDPNAGALTAAAHLSLPAGKTKEEALHDAQLSPRRFVEILIASGRLDAATDPDTWLREVFLPRLMRLSSQVLASVRGGFSTERGYFSIYGLDVLVDADLNGERRPRNRPLPTRVRS